MYSDILGDNGFLIFIASVVTQHASDVLILCWLSKVHSCVSVYMEFVGSHLCIVIYKVYFPRGTPMMDLLISSHYQPKLRLVLNTLLHVILDENFSGHGIAGQDLSRI